MRGGRGQLVRLADDKGVEAVPLVQRLGAGGDRGVCAARRVGGSEEIHLGPLLPVFVYPEDNRRGLAQERLSQAGKHGSVLGFVPFHGKLVWRPDDQPPLVEGYGLGGLEPRANRVVGKFAMSFVENALPGVFGGQLHRYSKTEGIFSRARDVTGEV